jgi:G3E family GTPase
MTPVTLVTGFLGSGKTTIIAHLIDDLLSQNVKVVFVKNEVGDEDLDGLIMKGKHIQTRELLNGCICCTLVGPFISAINELIETTHPDRIIIEASGTAETASIALMISSHPLLVRDGVINIIDVVNYEGSQDLSVTTRHQAQFTDLIVFNKIELVDLDQKQRVVGYVREVNEYAPIVEAPQGRVNPDLVFGISSAKLQTELAQYQDQEATEHQDGDPSHHPDHLAEDGIEGFHLETPALFDPQKLDAVLGTLPKAIFRVKGLVKATSGEILLINRIGNRTTITPVPTTELPPASHSKLIFIGFHAPEFKEEVLTAIKTAESA